MQKSEKVLAIVGKLVEAKEQLGQAGSDLDADVAFFAGMKELRELPPLERVHALQELRAKDVLDVDIAGLMILRVAEEMGSQRAIQAIETYKDELKEDQREELFDLHIGVVLDELGEDELALNLGKA